MKKSERQGGQYRQLLLAQRGQIPPQEEPDGRIWKRIRFYVCLCLFAAYVLLDYSSAHIASWDSERICQEVERDYSEQLGLDLNQALSRAASAIWISGS